MSVLSSLRSRRGTSGTPGGVAAPDRSAGTVPEAIDPTSFEVTPAQKRFFDTFGFMTFPGLFANDIGRITRGFEDVFDAERDTTVDTNVALHFEKKRSIIPSFIDRSDDLRWLYDDPRVEAVVSGLMACPYEYAESDGNLLYCDTSWHCDNYAAPMTRFHLKLFFYLDPLHGDNGAIRMMPGTNHWQTPYAKSVRESVVDPSAIEATYGVPIEALPSWTLENEPGDLLVGDFRTIHASFNGGERRRLFTVNFRERLDGDR